jgi:hypothetical protein
MIRMALSTLAETRQAALLQMFLTALTRGGPDGLPRPIELHAHDSVRYVGDMLAWIHQAVAWEHEFLESLFDIKSQGRMVGSVRDVPTDHSRADAHLWMARLMDAIVGGLAKPLRVNI